MNFLAHLFLSGNSEGRLIGNFIADAVKGSDWEQYDATVAEGIKIHRHIDTFTDTHPVVRDSTRRLQPVYHKYAGVIIDVFYDHFLAADWEKYAAVSLEEFSRHAYDIMSRNKADMPERSQFMLPYMIKHNWLVSYRDLDGINRALTGMSRRTRFNSGMEHATKDLKKDYELFKNEFDRYFPQLIAYVKTEFSISELPEKRPIS